MPDYETPWFAEQPGRVFVYRVNRRPMRDDNLFAPEGMPEDVFEHFVGMLAPGHEVVTGRRHQRTWRVGGVQIDRDEQVLLGKLGWLPRGEAVVPNWSEAEKDWTSSLAEPQGGEVMPFGFDGEKRLLAVLSDRSSAPPTIASVFEKVLRENEQQAIQRTTEWSVEPVLDSADFISWLRGLDVVTSVGFTARLPNPEPKDAFRDLSGRMRARRATTYSETMKSNRDEGLVGVEEDRDFKQAIAMGEQGFAELRGKGIEGGAVEKFSQRSRVATEHVDQLPATWPGVWDLFKSLLKDQLRRYLDDEAA